MEEVNDIGETMIKIAITGPESTGKSSLAEALAQRFGATLVPEYAREYLDNMHKPYERQDVIAIGVKQHELIQDAFQSSAAMVIADTELLVISIWLSHKYGESDPWIEQKLTEQPFDLFLLCDIDLPWVEDPLREHPHMRHHFFSLYLNRLKKMEIPFIIVKGENDDRFDNAENKIRELFFKHQP
jgi:NadR type nicotinamide-nucleotide adenylyltransferase